MSHPTPAQPDNDEIDLIQLAQTLWQSKVLILVITLVVTGIAAGYAFLSTPVYQTTVRILPPTANDLLGYNSASQLVNEGLSKKQNLPVAKDGERREPLLGIEPMSAEEAFAIFLRNLESDAIQKRFSEEYSSVIQPSVNLKISDPRRNSTRPATSLTVTGQDPQAIADWANAYVEFALEASKKEILGSLVKQISARQQGLKTEIDAIRQIAKLNRQNRIVRLENALAIAEALGLEGPTDGGTVIAINTNNASSDDSLLYLRGAQALRLELQHLKARQNDDAYIFELPHLQAKKTSLNGIDVHSVDLATAAIDSAATIPQSPTKPRKGLLLALGVLLGGMLGVFTVLLRDTLRKRV